MINFHGKWMAHQLLIISLFIPLFQKIFQLGKLLSIHCIWFVKPLLAEKNKILVKFFQIAHPFQKGRNAVLFSCRVQAQNMTRGPGQWGINTSFIRFSKGILMTLIWYCCCKQCSLLWPFDTRRKHIFRIFGHPEMFVKN